MAPNPESIALRLTRETGLAFAAQPGRPDAPGSCTLTPRGHSAGSTFRLVITREWRAVEVRFEHGAFSDALIEHMGRADAAGPNAFTAILTSCAANGAAVAVSVYERRHRECGRSVSVEHPLALIRTEDPQGTVAA